MSRTIKKQTLPARTSAQAKPLSVTVALLRGVNVGGSHLLRMEILRRLCESLGCSDVQTLLQSGNVVLRAPSTSLHTLGHQLETAIETELGFRPPITFRSTAELTEIVAANPYPEHALANPGKLHVAFLFDEPGKAARARLAAIPITPEQLHLGRNVLYIYYPEGAGRSRLRWPPIDKALGTTGTSRNWNTVLKLRDLAATLKASPSPTSIRNSD